MSLDPLTEWTLDDVPVADHWAAATYANGANYRLDLLRPLIAAADAIVSAWQSGEYLSEHINAYLAARIFTTPKGDNP